MSRLPKAASDKEIKRWAKTNDVFDRLDAGVSELVDDHSDLDRIREEAVFQDNTAQQRRTHDLIGLRKDILDSLKKVAGKGGVENVLSQKPKFVAMLKTAERRIGKGRGIKHGDFWKAGNKKK